MVRWCYSGGGGLKVIEWFFQVVIGGRVVMFWWRGNGCDL